MASQRSNTKQRRHELTEALRVSIAPDARMAVELVGLMLEDARSSLVNAAGDDMLRIQGEAQALQRLYKQLTTTAQLQEIR